jgi:hypothetical protein
MWVQFVPTVSGVPKVKALATLFNELNGLIGLNDLNFPIAD